VREAVLVGDAPRLRALAGPLRTKDQDVQRYFRKPS
jgi:hypothetical protein